LQRPYEGQNEHDSGSQMMMTTVIQ